MEYIDEMVELRKKAVENPLTLSLDVTAKCNYKCLHCYNNSGKPSGDELTDEELIDVMKQIAEIRPLSMCLCGGEPTLRDNIAEIIKIGTDAGIEVNMVSNGSLLNNQTLEKLKEAGIKTLQISLDGINAMQHDTLRGVSGAFDKALRAIKEAKKLNIRVITSFTPNKMNVYTIRDYFKLCDNLDLAEVRIMPLIPMGRGSKMDFLLLDSDEYFKLQLEIQRAKEIYQQNGMQIEWGDPLDHYTRFVKNAKVGINTIQLEIKANGNLTISTYIPIVVGNIRKHSLKEYWENGYKTIWANEKVVKYVRRIQNIYDINNLNPKPYSGEYYELPILS